jgi:NADPH:quinone reductase-like Zn-dependent oxidoreductase
MRVREIGGSMKAWQCNDSRPVSGLIRADVEIPQPGPGELLIQVHAAGVTPTELFWYPTTHQKSGENRPHAIPCHEFSGVVVAAGRDVDVVLGDEVFGMNDWFAEGAAAEFCCAPAGAAIPKPAWLGHAEAASIPIGALTAWQGLFDRAKLQQGERVLIHGGAGAVGVFAIQLARSREAQVLTTASAQHRQILLQLGAQQVIDYKSERFEDVAGDVDVVFDAVGDSTLERSWNILSPRGRLVTIAAVSETATDARTKRAFFIVQPDAKQLIEILLMIKSGRLQPIVNTVVAFDQLSLAFKNAGLSRRGCGKIVVAVCQTNENRIT